ncbi:hypothetical protein J6590_003696 [Homalodisca vitripennis]|nr:hypothetical protein J6590_003696 [Homalodisca vitripennis]
MDRLKTVPTPSVIDFDKATEEVVEVEGWCGRMRSPPTTTSTRRMQHLLPLEYTPSDRRFPSLGPGERRTYPNNKRGCRKRVRIEAKRDEIQRALDLEQVLFVGIIRLSRLPFAFANVSSCSIYLATDRQLDIHKDGQTDSYKDRQTAIKTDRQQLDIQKDGQTDS